MATQVQPYLLLDHSHVIQHVQDGLLPAGPLVGRTHTNVGPYSMSHEPVIAIYYTFLLLVEDHESEWSPYSAYLI